MKYVITYKANLTGSVDLCLIGIFTKYPDKLACFSRKNAHDCNWDPHRIQPQKFKLVPSLHLLICKTRQFSCLSKDFEIYFCTC